MRDEYAEKRAEHDARNMGISGAAMQQNINCALPPKSYWLVRVVNEPYVGPTEHIYGPFSADEFVKVQRQYPYKQTTPGASPWAVRVDHGRDFQLRD